MTMTITKAVSPADIQACLEIRLKIFVQGQNLPIAEELDGRDDESDHYLLTFDNLPIGTARVRHVDANKAKIERVAILEAYQGKGFGKKLMVAIITDLKARQKCTVAVPGAQTHAISFYEKLGFTICSDEYMDAGIPHKDMTILL